MTVNPAPWVLQGIAVVLPCSGRQVRLLVRYEDSPVGSYHESALLQRLPDGWTVVQMAVDNAAAQDAGRSQWGFPKTLAQFHWWQRGERLEIAVRHNPLHPLEGRTWHLRCWGWTFPVRWHTHLYQQRAGQRVRVPMRLQASARLCFSGRHGGLFLDPLHLEVAAAVPVEVAAAVPDDQTSLPI